MAAWFALCSTSPVLTAPSFKDSVLLLIDHQLEYRIGRMQLPGIEEAIRENEYLLTAARTAGAPVIHVVTHGRPGSSFFDPLGSMIDIIPELAPSGGEAVVLKRLPNSFAGTQLENLIRKTGRQSLIVSGFMTHMCVSTTVRAALDLGLQSTVVAGATATRELPDPFGGTIPASVVQRTALAELADRFALVVHSARDLEQAGTASA